MDLNIVQFQTSDHQKFNAVRKIRETVFIIEQEVDEEDEFDEFEGECQHYLMSLDGKAIGTARWRVIGEKVKLERFAVLKEYRSNNYGAQLLQQVIKDASALKKSLYLHAQLKAIPFYARQGFQQVGDLFLECDIEHYKMKLEFKS
ncbi:MAG: GNAT family N-acetyltransferase [Vicingaceae bacterium]